ncbi:unnamed protein product [Somion occarium]|uniref:DUF6535 domain-containing protein n=1 Tax=Somion occarium TaxID=3059160 RepID=A0ABP1EB71_9APHY
MQDRAEIHVQPVRPTNRSRSIRSPSLPQLSPSEPSCAGVSEANASKNQQARESTHGDGVQRVQVEPERTGWARIADMVRKYDEDKIKDVKEDIDTLLVFAGLFSAVLTAFVIESYTTLQDPGDVTQQILMQMSLQLASLTVTSSSINSTAPPFSTLPFKVTRSSIRVNTLWSCSLVCSLITASLGIFMKQWFHEYMAHESQSPRSQLRVRFFRAEGLAEWRVFELAALLPLLLQMALLLFFIGLSEFLRELNPVVGWITTGVMLIWLAAFIFTTLAPAFSSKCPYKTPMLKDMLRTIRPIISFILLNIVVISLLMVYLLILAFRTVVGRGSSFLMTWTGWMERVSMAVMPAIFSVDEYTVRETDVSDLRILALSNDLFLDNNLDATLSQWMSDVPFWPAASDKKKLQWPTWRPVMSLHELLWYQLLIDKLRDGFNHGGLLLIEDPSNAYYGLTNILPSPTFQVPHLTSFFPDIVTIVMQLVYLGDGPTTAALLALSVWLCEVHPSEMTSMDESDPVSSFLDSFSFKYCVHDDRVYVSNLVNGARELLQAIQIPNSDGIPSVLERLKVGRFDKSHVVHLCGSFATLIQPAPENIVRAEQDSLRIFTTEVLLVLQSQPRPAKSPPEDFDHREYAHMVLHGLSTRVPGSVDPELLSELELYGD